MIYCVFFLFGFGTALDIVDTFATRVGIKTGAFVERNRLMRWFMGSDIKAALSVLLGFLLLLGIILVGPVAYSLIVALLYSGMKVFLCLKNFSLLRDYWRGGR